MAGRNFIRGAGGGMRQSVTDEEVVRRTELVRLAKQSVGGRGLTEVELDAILPPVDCLRTRRRIGRFVKTLACASG